jgi:hypothetical protein
MMTPWKCFAAAIPLTLFVAGCPDEDVPPPAPGDLAQLEPPPEGTGFQITTNEIAIEPGDEVQNCYFFKVSELAASGGVTLEPGSTGPSMFLNRIQIAQRDGSHHMNVFRVKTIGGLDPAKGLVQEGKNGVGECFKSPNWADWPLIANSQQDGQLDWTYPEGVANELGADEWIMVQTHFVNATTQVSPAGGKVNINFWSVPKAQVQHQLGTLFATKQSIRVCASNPTPTFEGSCQFNSPDPVNIIGANGHFHSRGTKFEMYAWDGTTEVTPPASERFYTSDAWDDPPMLTSPELERAVPANAGVWYSCAYQWQPPEEAVGCEGLNKFDTEKYMTMPEALDCCYTFGPIVEKNEHCNIFVYYYPKQDDVNCF